MRFESIIRILEENGFYVKRTGRIEEIRVDCPFCINRVGSVDRNAHMYINIKDGLVHCFKCEYGSTLTVFLKELRIGVKFSDHKELNFTQYARLQSVITKSKLLKVNIPFPRIDLYDNPAKDFFVQYIREKRGFKEDIIWEWDLRVGLDDYKERIIFPVKEFFVDVYFTGRKIFDTRGAVKYKNPTRGEYGVLIGKSEILYNIDGVPEGADVVVVQEGPFDVIATHNKPYPCVALLGKTISRQQLCKLLLKRPKKVVVSLDADAKDYTYTVAKTISNVVSTSMLLLDKGDPADWKERYWEEGKLQDVSSGREIKEKLPAMLESKWKGKPLVDLKEFRWGVS